MATCRSFAIFQLLQYVPAHLPNTDTYLQRLSQTYPNGFPPGTIVFSLDVTNLYGNIPVDEAVQTVMNLLQEHRETINLFDLSWTDVEPLLRHCLTNSYLRFGQSFYKQTLGLPMGNRIAPSTAIIFMGALEDIYLSANRAQPELYLRYIDDCIVKHDLSYHFVAINRNFKTFQVITSFYDTIN